MNSESLLLLNLVRVGLGDEALADALAQKGVDSPDAPVDWHSFLGLAASQGMSPIVTDALQNLSDRGLESSLDDEAWEEERYACFGDLMASEQQWEDYTRSLGRLSEYLSRGGAERILILKGFGLALNYPQPAHRTMGDIDLFALDGKMDSAEAELAKLRRYKGRESDKVRHSHAVFNKISIENHFHFTDASNPDRDGEMEALLLREAQEHSRKVDVGEGAGVWLPSADFNAIFLIWHMAAHFTIEKVNMRQLTDWLCFLRAESGNIHWDKVEEIWSRSRKKRFADAVNGVMISYFGMDPSLVPPFERCEEDERRFMEFVLESPPLETRGIEAVVKYWRRRWNFRLAHDSHWLPALLKAVFSKI